MMCVYLVQHGEARAKDVDPERPLTERGRQDVRNVAALAMRLALDVHQIRHSGKTRAEQTAAILGEALAPAQGVVAAEGLSPLDDVAPVADALRHAEEPVMLVGHLPFMERLAGHLLVGDAERPVVKFYNGGIVCLVHGEQGWQVAWILTPEIAGM